MNRETCGKTGVLSDLRSSLYMDCNSATTKRNFPCMLHCSFTRCIIFRKFNSSKKKVLWWIIWCCSFLLYGCWIFIGKSHQTFFVIINFIGSYIASRNCCKYLCLIKFLRFSSQLFSELAHMKGMNLIWLSMQCPSKQRLDCLSNVQQNKHFDSPKLNFSMESLRRTRYFLRQFQ